MEGRRVFFVCILLIFFMVMGGATAETLAPPKKMNNVYHQVVVEGNVDVTLNFSSSTHHVAPCENLVSTVQRDTLYIVSKGHPLKKKVLCRMSLPPVQRLVVGSGAHVHIPNVLQETLMARVESSGQLDITRAKITRFILHENNHAQVLVDQLNADQMDLCLRNKSVFEAKGHVKQLGGLLASSSALKGEALETEHVQLVAKDYDEIFLGANFAFNLIAVNEVYANVHGNVQYLNVLAEKSTLLNASHLRANHADIFVHSKSQVRIGDTQELNGVAESYSKIFYSGKPRLYQMQLKQGQVLAA